MSRASPWPAWRTASSRRPDEQADDPADVVAVVVQSRVRGRGRRGTSSTADGPSSVTVAGLAQVAVVAGRCDVEVTPHDADPVAPARAGLPQALLGVFDDDDVVAERADVGSAFVVLPAFLHHREVEA